MINLRFIFYLPLIFFFLPAFSFYVPILNGIYTYFLIFVYITVALFFIINGKYCTNKLLKIYHKTPFKIFIWTLCLVILNSLFLSLLGKVSILSCLRTTFMQIFLYVLPIMFYFMLLVGKYCSIKKFIKIFISGFWIMLILGFIAYIGQYWEIDFINDIFDFFANARLIKFKEFGINQIASNYISFGLPRLDNLFQEPSYYAKFLYTFLPLIYAFSLSKIKIYKNKYLNILIKKTTIPFTWISLILTMSPIFLLLSLMITFIYFSKEVFLLIKRYWTIIALSIFIVIIILSKIDLSETYLSRIINLLSQVRSFEDFVIIEPSLATRVCTYINSIILFLKNPFTGIGFGYLPQAILEQFKNSPIPLTIEIINKIDFAEKTNTKYSINSNYFIDFVASNGIIIFSVLIYFYYKLFTYLKAFMFHFSEKISFNNTLSKSLYYTYISVIIGNFYDSSFTSIEIYLILSIIILYIFKYKRMV